MKQFMDITKALSDENRIRVLMFLKKRELCVCRIIEMLALAPSTVSKHMQILKQAGLVESRKHGRWIYYSLSEEDNSPLATKTLKWLADCLRRNQTVCRDRRTLKEVMAMDISQLACKK